MPKVPTSQIIGNQGEALVAYQLSRFCLVRHVTAGTDVGVDLFCESITESQPNNHFWIQVKSSNEPKDRISFEKDKVEYWSRQPIPVFIFLTSQKDSADDFSFGVIDLTEYYLSRQVIENESKIFEISFMIDSIELLKKFVSEKVPVSIARWWLKEGVILPSKPNLKLDYVMKYHSEGCSLFAPRITKNLGRSAGILLNDLINFPDIENEIPTLRKRLESILECFIDYGNWDFHNSLGDSKYYREDYSNAKGHFKKALSCVELDSNIKKEDEPWKSIVQHLKFKIHACESKVRKDP